MGGGNHPSMDVLKDWMYEVYEYNTNGKATMSLRVSPGDDAGVSFETSPYDEMMVGDFSLDFPTQVPTQDHCMQVLHHSQTYGMLPPASMPMPTHGFDQNTYIPAQGVYSM
jgi:hypothetical protein